MTFEIYLVLGVIAFTVWLFIREQFSVGINALIVLSVLVGLGIFFPQAFPSAQEGLSGFANAATITIMCMFILSSAIEKTGVLQQLSRDFSYLTKKSYIFTLLLLGILVLPLSAIITNTAVVAVMIPFIIEIARKNDIPSTKLMIPLSYFSMMAGSLTLIGSSTNILSNSLMQELSPATPSFNIFSPSVIAIGCFLGGLIYFLTIGKVLLPKRKSPQEQLEVPDFFIEIEIEKGNEYIGKTVKESRFGDHYGVEIIRIVHNGRNYKKHVEDMTINEGDIYLVKVQEKSLSTLLDQKGIKILSNFNENERRRSFEGGKVVKAVFTSNIFDGKEIQTLDFLEQFGVNLIGINYKRTLEKRLKNVVLETGEIFLLHMTSRRFERFKKSDHFLFLDTIEEKLNPQNILPASIILLLVALIPAFTGVPIVVTALMGVVAMIIARCINPNEIFDSIHWDIIFLIAGLVPLGIAVQKSGAGSVLSEVIVSNLKFLTPFTLLLLFYALTTIISEFISNTATVVVLLPIALSSAQSLGMNPQAITLVIMFAGSMCLMSPFGYQTNTMIYRAANYKLLDFVKVGLPLNVVLMFITCSLVSYLYF